MSRKKFRLDRAEILSRDPAHCNITSLEKFCFSPMLVSSLLMVSGALGFERVASELVL
jgi:hypothetical protein